MFSNGKFSTCYLEERSGSKTKTNHLFWGGQMNFGVFFWSPGFFFDPINCVFWSRGVFLIPWGVFFWSLGVFFLIPWGVFFRSASLRPRQTEGVEKKTLQEVWFLGCFFCGGQLCFFEIGLVCCTIVLLLGLLLGLTFSWVFAIWLGIFWEGFHPRIWRDFGVFFLIPCRVFFDPVWGAFFDHSQCFFDPLHCFCDPNGVFFWSHGLLFLVPWGVFLISWGACFDPMHCFFDFMGCFFWSPGVLFLIPRQICLIPWGAYFCYPCFKAKGFLLRWFFEACHYARFFATGFRV